MRVGGGGKQALQSRCHPALSGEVEGALWIPLLHLLSEQLGLSSFL